MTSNNILIRQEQPGDYPQVFSVHELAFNRTDEANLVNSLRKGDQFIPELSLVAEINGEIIGHIVYTKIEIHQGQERFRSEEHTSELQSLMRISYAVFCLKK